MLLGTPAPHSCTPAPHTCSWPDHHSLCLETLRNHFILPFIPFHVSHPGLLGHHSRSTLIPKGLAGQRSKSPTTHSGIAQCAALSSPHSYHCRNTCVWMGGCTRVHVCTFIRARKRCRCPSPDTRAGEFVRDVSFCTHLQRLPMPGSQ